MRAKLNGNFVIVILLVVVMLVSLFPLGNKMSKLETYGKQVEYLDKKSGDALALTAIAAAASTTISLLPNDIGTPVANELMDLTSWFGIALAAIILEKYLLSLIGIAVFRIIIPIGCVFGIIALLRKNSSMFNFAKKLIVFGIVISLIVPASVIASQKIEEICAFTIEDVQQEVETLSEEKTVAETVQIEETSSNNIFRKVWSGIQKAGTQTVALAKKVGTTITDGANTVLKNTQTMLSRLLEKLAVLIVTSCLIPILVMLAFVYVAKALLGVDFTGAVKTIDAKRANIVSAINQQRMGIDDKPLAKNNTRFE